MKGENMAKKIKGLSLYLGEVGLGLAGLLYEKGGDVKALATIHPKDSEGRQVDKAFKKATSGRLLETGVKGVRVLSWTEMVKVGESAFDDPYWGEGSLRVYYDVSVVAPSEQEQVFILPGKLEEEEIVRQVREEFFRNRLKDLPIPVEEDWEEFLWAEIAGGLSFLESYGRVPWSGAILRLSLREMEAAAARAHAAAEFKKIKGRVPLIKDLLSIYDVQGFNPKEWQRFMGELGGKEAFEKLPSDQRRLAVGVFEVCGGEDGAKVFKWLEKKSVTDVDTLGGQLWLRLKAADNNQRLAFKRAIGRTALHFKENGSSRKGEGLKLLSKKDLVSRTLSLADRIFDEHRQNISNENWGAIEKLLEKVVYGDVEGVEELADACGRVGVSTATWPRYKELWSETIHKILTTAKEYPTISGKLDDEWGWEVIDMSNPRAWVVGIETYCCQHLGSVGGACVEYAARNPATSGILRVYRGDRTMAQSFLWLGENGFGTRTLVLDNIEAAGDNLPKKVIEAYKDFAEAMAQYARLFRIEAITIGQGFLEDWLRELASKNPKELKGKIPHGLGYTDANSQKLLASYTSLLFSGGSGDDQEDKKKKG